MKLIVVFDVPDGQAEAYADVAARMIQLRALSEEQGIKHWSFDMEMRPTNALLVPDPEAVMADMPEAADMMAALLGEGS